MLIYALTSRRALGQGNRVMERLLGEFRRRIGNKIRRSERLIVEGFGRGERFNHLAVKANQISQTFPLIINSAQQMILLVFCFFYVAYLSVGAAVVIAGSMGIGVFLFLRYRRSLNEQMLLDSG